MILLKTRRLFDFINLLNFTEEFKCFIRKGSAIIKETYRKIT